MLVEPVQEHEQPRHAGPMGLRVHLRLIEPDQLRVLDGHLEQRSVHRIGHPRSVLELDVQIDSRGPPGLPDEVADHPQRPVVRHRLQPRVPRELEQPVPDLLRAAAFVWISHHGCGALNCGDAMRAAALSAARFLIVASTPAGHLLVQVPLRKERLSRVPSARSIARDCRRANRARRPRAPSTRRSCPQRTPRQPRPRPSSSRDTGPPRGRRSPWERRAAPRLRGPGTTRQGPCGARRRSPRATPRPGVPSSPTRPRIRHDHFDRLGEPAHALLEDHPVRQLRARSPWSSYRACAARTSAPPQGCPDGATAWTKGRWSGSSWDRFEAMQDTPTWPTIAREVLVQAPVG